MIKTLRPYQRESIDKIYQHWRTGGGHGLIVAPTGSGKSLILSTLIREIVEDYPGTRILVLCHVMELIKQDYAELGHPLAGIY